MNLKPWEFWDELNPRDFLKMCEGFNLKHRREYSLWLENMKMLRWVGSILYNSNVAKNNRIKDPQKLYPLPELKEDKPKAKPRLLSKEDLAELETWPAPRPLGDGKTLLEVVEEYKKK